MRRSVAGVLGVLVMTVGLAAVIPPAGRPTTSTSTTPLSSVPAPTGSTTR